VPSLLGLWYRGPFEHSGSLAALEDLFDAKRLRELESENAKLKRIVADQVLDMSAMKELLQKHW
jgi:hypothetical protein